MNQAEGRKDEMRTCHTFDEKEPPIQIKTTSSAQKTTMNIPDSLGDLSTLHFLDDNSLAILDRQNPDQIPSLIHCFADPPRLSSLQKTPLDQQDKIDSLQHLYTRSEQVYILNHFTRFLGSSDLNSEINQIVLYGRTLDQKLLFEFIEFKKGSQGEPHQPGSLDIEKFSIQRTLTSLSKKDEPVKVLFDNNLNFGVILYEHGVLSAILPLQNSTGKRQLINQQWKEVQLCKKQISDVLLINVNGYKCDLVWTSKTGLFILEKIDFFNVKVLSLESSNCLVGGEVSQVCYDQQCNDLYFIEKKNEKDSAGHYLSRLMLQGSNELFQVRLDGPCLELRRNGRHAFVILEKTLQTEPIQVLKIYDLQNKYLAFTFKRFNLKIFSFNFHAHGALLLAHSSKTPKQLINIQEDSDQEKFEKFRKRRFFELAAQFAASKNKPALKFQIYKEAGDYYFEDGQFDTAVEFYILTIEALETRAQDSDEFQPSFIIKNFLKSTLLQYITRYLEALHQNSKNLANLYDTSLLVSIYLKQEKEREVENFFQSYQFKTKEKITKTIDLCLEAQKFELAKKIAEQNQRYDKYLEISIENSFFGELEPERAAHEAENILTYLKDIPFRDFQDAMQRLGYILYPHQPQQTFELVVSKIEENLLKASDFFSILAFLDIFQNFEEVYRLPQTELFVDFVFKKLPQFGSDKKQAATFVLNYLVFCYARLPEERPRLEKKLSSFLNSNDTRVVADSYLVLLFSKPELRALQQSVMYKSGRKTALIDSFFRAKDYEECYNYCCANKEDPELPVHFLKLLCELDQTPEEIESDKSPNKYISMLLELVELKQQFGPLFLMKFLKKNRYLKIGNIRGYYLKLLQRKQERIKILREETNESQNLLDSKKAKLLDLKTSPRYFQFTICQFCKENISQTTIYFFCGHFYHRNCIEKTQCQECDMMQRDKIEQREMFINERVSVQQIHPFDYENVVDQFGKASFQINQKYQLNGLFEED